MRKGVGIAIIMIICLLLGMGVPGCTERMRQHQIKRDTQVKELIKQGNDIQVRYDNLMKEIRRRESHK